MIQHPRETWYGNKMCIRDRINDVVQTNSATSEECAAASQEMSREAENLREMIKKFKVAENKN